MPIPRAPCRTLALCSMEKIHEDRPIEENQATHVVIIGPFIVEVNHIVGLFQPMNKFSSMVSNLTILFPMMWFPFWVLIMELVV